MKSIRILAVLGVVLLAGCVNEDGFDYGENSEVHFTYVWGDEEFTGVRYQDLEPVMSWINRNTDENASVLAWWDYGHMLRGVAGRRAIAWEPSREILYTVSKYAVMSEEERETAECDCSPHGRIADLVGAFVNEDSTLMEEVMYKHDLTHVLVTNQDEPKLYAMLLIAGRNPEVYMDGYTANEQGEKLMLIKLMNHQPFENFDLVYSDGLASLYRYVKR